MTVVFFPLLWSTVDKSLNEGGDAINFPSYSNLDSLKIMLCQMWCPTVLYQHRLQTELVLMLGSATSGGFGLGGSSLLEPVSWIFI